MSPYKTLGADLRALRKTRKVTIENLASALGKSIGWVSQIERDLSQPTAEDLAAIATYYKVPMSLFFGQSDAPINETGKILRKGARRRLGQAEDGIGLVEELLSPDLTDSFEVIHSTFLPHSRLTEPRARATQELGVLISGKLHLWLDEEEFVIQSGDSFRVRGQSFRWANPYDVAATAIWVISPPVY